MTTPLSDLFPDDTTQAAPPVDTSPLGGMFPDDAPDETVVATEPTRPSLLTRVKTIGNNWAGYWLGSDQERNQMFADHGYTGPGTAAILGKKAENFFGGVGMFADAMGQNPMTAIGGVLTGTKNIIGAQMHEFKTDPGKAFDGLIQGFVVDPALDAITTISGTKFDDPSGIRAANPEERATATVNTIANGVAFAIAKGAHSGVEALMLRGQRAALGGLTDEAALIAAEALPRGVPSSISTQALRLAAVTQEDFFVRSPFVRSALTNASSGAAAGLAYGMIQGADSPDQASQMLASAFMFAGIGTAATLITGGIGVVTKAPNQPLEMAKLAGQLANYRQFKATQLDLLPDVVQRVDALATSETLNQAIAKVTKPHETNVIRGVTDEELTKIQTDNPHLNYTVHKVPGAGPTEILNDVLISGESADLGELVRPQAAPLEAIGLTGTADRVVKLQQQLRFMDARGRAREARRGLWSEKSPEYIAKSAEKDMLNRISYEKELQELTDQLTDDEQTSLADIAQMRQRVNAHLEKSFEQLDQGVIPTAGTPANVLDFQRTGFIKEQIADHGGNDVRIKEFVGPNAIVETMATGKRYTVDVNDLTDINHKEAFVAATKEAVTTRLYEDFRKRILGQVDDPTVAHKLTPEETARLQALETKQSTVHGQDPATGRDILEPLTGDEAKDLVRLRAMKEPIPEANRGAFTELDRARNKVDELESMQTKNKFLGNIDAELTFWKDYVTRLETGKVENTVIREAKTKPSELKEVLGNGKSFDESVNDFAKEFKLGNVEGLKQQFAKRFSQELLKDMNGSDAEVYRRAISEYGRELERRQLEDRVSLHRVVDRAGRAGLYLERAESGEVILRDVNSNKKVGQVSTLAEARNFINKAGSERGIEFDGGSTNGPIPPWVIGGDLSTPRGPLPPNQLPYDPPAVTKLQELLARATTAGKALVTNNKLFLDHDITYQGKTSFFNNVFRVVQGGYDAFTFNMRKVEPRLIRIQNMARTLGAERRVKVGEALEAMSPDEVINLYFKHRQLGAGEIELGDWLSDNKVDLREIYDFRAARREATEGMSRGSVEYENEILRLKLEAGLHENPILAEAIDRVDNLKGDKGASLRLARSRMARDGQGELSRQEFMKENKFGPQEDMLLKELETAYNDFADTFNIPDGRRLGHYMTHIRLYEEGLFVPSTVREFSSGFGNVDTDFYARMARTGEIDTYERDPVVALVRYTRAGLKADHLMPALDAAKKSAETMLKALPNDGRKVAVHNSLQRFFSDVQNVTPKFDRVINETLDRFINGHLGLNIDAKKIANAIGLIGETAAQGAKPLAGVRDFVTNVGVMFTEHGLDKTRKFLQYGLLGAEARGTLHNTRSLVESGVVPERSALILENPAERGATLDPSAAIRGANRIAEVGLDVSLQPAAYRFAHAGVYLTFLKDSDAALAKLSRKILNKSAAYKEVGLNAFELPIQQEYDRLVTAAKFDEASVYLAKIAQEQIIGKFGQSNGLHYSGNLAGRIFGQFGTWSAFQARNIGRQITTGTLAERGGKIARAAAFTYGLSKVADATGLDLGNWYIFPGSNLFDDNAPVVPVATNLGGPLVESSRTVWDALTGRGMRKSEAMRKLKQILPLDKNGDWQGPHLYMPFSYQIDAMINAFHSAKAGKLGQAAFESTGGRPPRPAPGQAY